MEEIGGNLANAIHPSKLSKARNKKVRKNLQNIPLQRCVTDFIFVNNPQSTKQIECKRIQSDGITFS